MPLDTGTRRRRGSPADEELRSIRTLGRWFVLKTDFTLRPTVTTGFSVVEDEGGGCDEPG
jgi:hypothetical protein